MSLTTTIVRHANQVRLWSRPMPVIFQPATAYIHSKYVRPLVATTSRATAQGGIIGSLLRLARESDIASMPFSIPCRQGNILNMKFSYLEILTAPNYRREASLKAS